MVPTAAGSTTSATSATLTTPTRSSSIAAALLPKPLRAVPFAAVEVVRPRERTVVVHLDRSALERAPSA